MLWTPHTLADQRRSSAIRLAEGVLATDGLLTAHLREALSIAIWKYTEADGKFRTRYRSAAAVGAADKLLNHEHVVTRKRLIDRMLAEPGRCAEIMSTAVGCCVLRDEHALLTAVEKQDPTLDGWARYHAAGIEVVDLAAPRRSASAA